MSDACIIMRALLTGSFSHDRETKTTMMFSMDLVFSGRTNNREEEQRTLLSGIIIII